MTRPRTTRPDRQRRPRTGLTGRHRILVGLVLLAAAVLSGYSFIAPGHPTTVDIWPHLVRQQVVSRSLSAGESPFWSFIFYGGYPHLRFYGPLLALLGGLLALAVGNQLLAVKTLLFLLHLGSAAVMLLYLRRRTGRDVAAAAGTLVYLLVPWRVLFISIGGNYPVALVYLLLPACFFAFDALAESGERRHALLLGLAAGLLVLAHALYAAFTVALLALALAGWLARGRKAAPPAGRVLAGVGIAAGGGLALSAFFLVPFLVGLGTHAYPQPDIRLSPPGIGTLLWPSARHGGYAGAYLGLSIVLLVAAALGYLLADRGHRRRAAFPAVGLTLGLAFSLLVPHLGGIGRFLVGGLPPVRFLVFWVFFAAVLVALGGARFEERFLRTSGRSLAGFLLLAGVLAADCLPALLRISYPTIESFLGVRRHIYQLLRADRPVRVFDVSLPEDRIDELRRTVRYPALGYLFGGFAGPFGPPYHQFAPPSMLYVYPWTNLVAADLGDTTRATLTPTSRKALALMGISHLITLPALMTGDDDAAYLLTKADMDWDDRFMVPGPEPPLVFGPTRAGLVLASNTVRSVPAAPVTQANTMVIAADWRALLDFVDVDSSLRYLSFIPVPGREPTRTLTDESEASGVLGQPDITVHETTVTDSRVGIRLESRTECFIRLAVSYYPELSVRLNGRETEFHETADHFIWLHLPPGSHELTINAPLGLLRTILIALGLATLLAGATMLGLTAARRRRPKHRR